MRRKALRFSALRELNVPVLDAKGNIRHNGGVADAPGLYVIGLPFLRRRKSSFIHGSEDDARDLAAHLRGYLDAVCGKGRPMPVPPAAARRKEAVGEAT